MAQNPIVTIEMEDGGKMVAELYPDVKFELLSDVSPITIEQLKTDRCDVGFLNFPIPEDDGIVVRQTSAATSTKNTGN